MSEAHGWAQRPSGDGARAAPSTHAPGPTVGRLSRFRQIPLPCEPVNSMESFRQPSIQAATDDAPPASGTPTDGPAAPGAGTPPETVVDLFEGAVGLCLRLVVVGKGGDWTPQLENACRFTPSERNRLLVTAPYVAQYVGDALRSSPYVGIALFGMSALEVVTARLALVKAAAPARRLPNNRTTPPPAAQVDDDEEDLEPFPQTASPGVALVDFKANLGE